MATYVDWVRKVCLALPHTTEDVQWEHDLLFRIANKIYCVANLEPGLGPTKIAFKCTPEKFAELVEVEGIIPAPYMARNHWVAMTEVDALRPPELQALIEWSYRLVMEKLPKRKQAELSETAPAKKKLAGKKRTAKKTKAKTKASGKRKPIRKAGSTRRTR
jgi:predicted DNA-binding protein (MmcQ/YjbR family)